MSFIYFYLNAIDESMYIYQLQTHINDIITFSETNMRLLQQQKSDYIHLWKLSSLTTDKPPRQAYVLWISR